MQRAFVSGGGGTRLYVEETGNRTGRPVLFLHGYSQCHLAWKKQMASSLLQNLRLVTLDLRGHGLSDKPHDAYTDSRLWAEDVQAVIMELALEQPILCGWSYGGVVIADYLQYYGEDHVGGIHLVSAVARLGEPVMPFLGPKFVACIPGFFSFDVPESATALQIFVKIATHAEPTLEDFSLFLGCTTMVPPYVRQGLFHRTLNYDELLSHIHKPVLIAHGVEDEIVLHTMSAHNAHLIKHAQVSSYPNCGHAPFWEAAKRFNGELKRFAASLPG